MAPPAVNRMVRGKSSTNFHFNSPLFAGTYVPAFYFMKPFSEACEENKQPILDVLQEHLRDRRHVLEIGSGTGQHAVYFAQQLPHIFWQTSDREENHAGIHAWLNDTPLENVFPPLALDVLEDAWPTQQYDAVFSANTTHIMSWQAVEAMFAGIAKVLSSEGVFCLYGPFNIDGRYTAESNARFDTFLKNRDPLSGIRDMVDLKRLAETHQLTFMQDIEMPVNNRILVWQKN